MTPAWCILLNPPPNWLRPGQVLRTPLLRRIESKNHQQRVGNFLVIQNFSIEIRRITRSELSWKSYQKNAVKLGASRSLRLPFCCCTKFAKRQENPIPVYDLFSVPEIL